MVDLYKPRGAQQPRRPTDSNQKNGRVINPPRFAHLGGLSSATKTGPKNKMMVEKPTNVKVI